MPRDERFVYTGISATELEEQQMQNPPEFVSIVPAYQPPTQAEIMHSAALAHGLPDIHGFYGYDFEEHEFIKLPGSKVKRVAAPSPPEPPRALDSEELEDYELEDAELDAALRQGFEE